MDHTTMTDKEDADASIDVSGSMSKALSVSSCQTGSAEGCSDDGVIAIRAQLSAEQSRNVLRLRVLVIFVLMIACVVLAALMYQINRQAESNTYESQFSGTAAKLIETFEDVTDHMGIVAGIGIAFASSDQEWPFANLKDFQQIASHAKKLSGVISVGIHPVVYEHDFDAWNDFVAQPEQKRWIADAIIYQEHIVKDRPDENEEEQGDEHGEVNEHGEEQAGGGHRDLGGSFAFRILSGEKHGELDDEGASQLQGQQQQEGHDGQLDFSDPIALANETVVPPMHYYAQSTDWLEGGKWVSEEPGQVMYLPRWQTTPYVATGLVNTNLLKDKDSQNIALHVLDSGMAVLGGYLHAPPGNADSANPTTSLMAQFDAVKHGGSDHGDHEDDEGPAYKGDPISNFFLPIFDTLKENEGKPRKVVGVLSALIHWVEYFSDILPDSVPPVVLVLEYQCPNGFVHDHHSGEEALLVHEDHDERGTKKLSTEHGAGENVTGGSQIENQHDDEPGTDSEGDEYGHREGGEFEEGHETKVAGAFTYRLQGSAAQVVGFGDLHDPKFDGWQRNGTLRGKHIDDGTPDGIPVDTRCLFQIHVYPSQAFYDQYNTSKPLVITLTIVAVFVFAILMFVLYDRIVEHRQSIILKKATQSTALLASLFPKNVRDRLMADDENTKNQVGKTKGQIGGAMEAAESKSEFGTAIADLFPHCTVFFADISGFSAWSSTREPCQVFELLQSVFHAFDQLAKRRRVFKVETIGDTYVAVTGLPKPQDRHALIMVRFAWDCQHAFREVSRLLESKLGPDTGDLSMRFGLHSGPVTAGVLRGDRARFQLFGDTVNIASRMESTGMKGKIQVSDATAALLRKAGKEEWLIPREDSVEAKGKGVLRTFWIMADTKHWSTNKTAAELNSSVTEHNSRPICSSLTLEQGRLVGWMVEILLEDIKKIIHARGKAAGSSPGKQKKGAPSYFPPDGRPCMQEVQEVIVMPRFDADSHAPQGYSRRLVEVDDVVVHELGEYVKSIASMYKQNPFHNFKHACHVTMSVRKLYNRILLAQGMEKDLKDEAERDKTSAMQHLYNYTHGLSSDPMTMFAMTFSALIHDVDHRGVSNTQLSMEEPAMAARYNNQSLAEQNSLDLGWNLLMEVKFSNLRSCVFASQEDLMRFRQLVVNVVLATDIFDKELNDLRKRRWEQAFSCPVVVKEDSLSNSGLDSDRRATIVIEHIIQASDVSHTMQHWHVYQKWNRCLFKEMWVAHKTGRFAKNPADFWYHGEIGFFDNYIIPLAKKLETCGIFGVSSDEYLNYALQNRAEWEVRGQEIIAAWIVSLTENESFHDGVVTSDEIGNERQQHLLSQEESGLASFSSRGDNDDDDLQRGSGQGCCGSETSEETSCASQRTIYIDC